jgi:hypothetical protein
MKFLHEGFNTKDIKKSTKNKWRWEWLSKCDRNGDNYGNWLKKPDVPGVAFCTVCRKTIKYGSSGKKRIKTHTDDPNHMKNKLTVKHNQVCSNYLF